MRVAELFAGAGGMALGFHRAGWETAWTAELADFPSRVTRHHWPHVPQYGDVSTLDGRELVAKHGPIDLLAGGSPCQDLSVAGKRAGLAGARSGLFHQQIRLWEETGAPLMLWENVAGSLSSHHGKDFAAVLSAFVGAPVAVPRDGWTGERSSGVVSGPAGVAAWRLLDAQYFGVAQRRLRVFVLGSRTGTLDPAQVLLEPEGVYGHPPTRESSREGIAVGAGSGAESARGVTVIKGAAIGRAPNAGPQYGDTLSDGSCYTLMTNETHAVLAFHHTQDPISGPSAPRHGAEGMGVLAFDQHNQTVGDVMPSLRTNGANSGTPLVARYLRSDEYVADEVGSTLAARDSRGPQDLVTAGIPRRLTPRECERLMSWPDDWTNVPDARGKPASDAVRYKAIGNGVCSNVAQWLAARTAHFYQRAA